MHMTCCQHPGQKKMLRLTISLLSIWMTDTRVDPVLVNMVEDFLLAQGQRPIMECLSVQTPKYVNLAGVCDRIGYGGLVEGIIASMWLEVVRSILKEAGLRLSPQQWGRDFVAKLINITHKQWIFWNSKKHFRGEGGLTAAESQSIIDRVEELMHTDLLRRTAPEAQTFDEQKLWGSRGRRCNASTILDRQHGNYHRGSTPCETWISDQWQHAPLHAP